MHVMNIDVYKFTPCILFELPSLVGRNIYVPD